MTRTDVRKLAWTLRLLGLGMLGGAAVLMLMSAGRLSAPVVTPPIAGIHAAGIQVSSAPR